MIINFEDLPDVRKEHAQERIGFAGGCFDLVHEGHIFGMERCKELIGPLGILVVGVSSDERVRQRKGPGRPFREQLGRIIVVNALRPVDYTFIMPMPEEGGDTPTIQVIKALRPDVFADHEENRERWTPVIPLLNSLGTELKFNDAMRYDSTTDIARRVATQSNIDPVAERPIGSTQ